MGCRTLYPHVILMLNVEYINSNLDHFQIHKKKRKRKMPDYHFSQQDVSSVSLCSLYTSGGGRKI